VHLVTIHQKGIILLSQALAKGSMNNLCKYALLVIIILFVQGCAASSITKVYRAPYSSIELELTKFLDINSITFDNEGGIRSENIPYSKLRPFLANQGDYQDRNKDKKRYKPSYEIIANNKRSIKLWITS